MITITFASAEGIQAGKTKIKSLSLDLGLVETVEPSKNMKQIVVKAQLERFAKPLLRDDTHYRVVSWNYRVDIRIDDWHGSLAGEARTLASWVMIDVANEHELSRYRFE